MPLRRALLLAVGVAAVGFAAIFVKLARAPSLSIALYRNAFAAAVLLPLALARRPGELRRLTARQWAAAIGAGALLAIHFATWISSLALTTVASSVVLVSASPVFSAAGSRLLFRERTSRAALLGIAVALAGAGVVSGGDIALSGRALAGDLLALAGAVTASGYFLAGRGLRQEISLLTYVAVAYTACAVVLVPIAIVGGAPLGGLPARSWIMFALLALVPQLVGHTTFNYLLRDMDATLVGIAVMGEPIVSTALAALLLRQVPPWTALAGGAVLLAGVYVALVGQSRAAAGRARAAPVELPLE